MSDSIVKKTLSPVKRVVRRLLQLFQPAEPIPEILLIHTPKCAGTYLVKHYQIEQLPQIKYVGHANFRQLQISPQTRIVGTIREPADWYASYYFFCRKSLAEAPQSKENFPETHPISVLSENGTLTFEQMLQNLDEESFLKNVIDSGVKEVIYAQVIEDIFGYMQRTKTGFWSWTMMYHFSKLDSSEFRSRDDVIQEARNIIKSISFIHQENIDQDTEKLLQIPKLQGSRINDSPRPKNEVLTENVKAIVKKLDGDVAEILGGYA